MKERERERERENAKAGDKTLHPSRMADRERRAPFHNGMLSSGNDAEKQLPAKLAISSANL